MTAVTGVSAAIRRNMVNDLGPAPYNLGSMERAEIADRVLPHPANGRLIDRREEALERDFVAGRPDPQLSSTRILFCG